MALLPGEFTPTLVESMVRVATWIPFEAAAKGMLNHFTKVDVSGATVRRKAERAGQAYVTVQTDEVVRLERERPEAPRGTAVLQLSVDGAMVPLLHKQWGEAKTLVIGTLGEPVLRKGEWQVHTEALSYFSRLTDSDSFARLATVETHRRGVETAGKVCAVNDGAEWEQKFVDLHRPDAVRILDWGHGAEYVAAAGQAVFGAGTTAFEEWFKVQLDELRHGEPQKVLGKLRGLRDELALQIGEGQENEALKTVAGSLQYLEKREEQIRYAEFSAAGYPIGSGAVESANKLVVEARLKGAGMHWAPGHVDGMLALRNVVCSGRWEEAWPPISACIREGARARSGMRRDERRAAIQPVSAAVTVAFEATSETAMPVAAQPVSQAAAGAEEQAVAGPHRPAANHPWRRMPIGRARWASS